MLSLVLILLVRVSSIEEEPRLIHFADLKTSQSGLLGSEAPQDSNGMVLLRFRELQKQQPGLAKEEKKCKILIFNFYNYAKENDYDWLSIELADSLSRNLPKISGVDLAELETVKLMRYSVNWGESGKITKKQLAAIVQRTGADIITLGSYAVRGGQLLVNLELVRSSGEGLRLPQIKGSIKRVWEVETKMAADVAKIAGLKVSSNARQRLNEYPTLSSIAFEEFCRGKQAPEGSYRKIRHLKKAIDADPNFVEAHYLLGNAYCGIAMAYRYVEWFNMALEEYRKTVALDPSYAEAHCAMGLVYMINSRYDLSRESLEKTLEIDPGMKLARNCLLRLEAAINSPQSSSSASLP